MAKRHRGDDTGGWLFLVLGVGALGYAVHEQAKTAAANRAAAFVQKAVRTTCAVLGVVAPPVRLVTDGAANAFATRTEIVVNVRWIAGLLDTYCGDVACREGLALATVAHEIAHAVDPFLFTDRSPWPRELRADRVAGRVLALVGASPHEFVRVLANLSPVPTATHPPAMVRIAAVAEGHRAGLADLARTRVPGAEITVGA